jgi:4-hydroxyacetophenone monooxygenase
MVRRLVVDNGFYDALKRDNVGLITDNIETITETGIKTKDGKERKYDMIVLGAGFKTSQYLWPVDYTGTDGMTLTKAWKKDGARSYLGMTMPHYPNLFTLYGPNHQPRGGSLYSYGEMWARYAVASIAGMIERGARSMEIKKNVFDEYQASLDKGNKKIIWESEGAAYCK